MKKNTVLKGVKKLGKKNQVPSSRFESKKLIVKVVNGQQSKVSWDCNFPWMSEERECYDNVLDFFSLEFSMCKLKET